MTSALKGLVAAYAVVFVVFAVSASGFLTPVNFVTMLLGGAPVAIMALGLAPVVLLGHVDLSVASVQSAAAALAASLMITHHIPVGVAMVVVLCAGAAFGFVNGWLVHRWQIPSFAVTLASMSIAQGGALLLTSSATVYGFPDGFRALASMKLAGVAAPVWLTIALFGAAAFVLSHSRFGLNLYATGGSVSSAQRAGVPIGAVTVVAFVFSGTMAAVAGMIVAARIDAANAQIGASDLLEVVAVVVIGGCSLFGGYGSIAGVALAAVLVITLNNGLLLLGIDPYWKEVLMGVSIIFVLAVEAVTRWRRTRRLLASTAEVTAPA